MHDPIWTATADLPDLPDLDAPERCDVCVVGAGIAGVAVYRDEQGRIHERSAVCTHAGCIVHWNSTSGSWDCPCHGSRYSPDGQVLNGPAVNALAPVDRPAAEDEGFRV